MAPFQLPAIALLLLARALASPIPAPLADAGAVSIVSARDLGFSPDRVLPRFPDNDDDDSEVPELSTGSAHVPALQFSKAVDLAARDDSVIPVDEDLVASQDGDQQNGDGDVVDDEEEGEGSDDGEGDDEGEDDGSEDDGSEDDGSEDDGSEDDGSVDDGSEDDGSVDDGSEDDGSEDNGSDGADNEGDSDVTDGADDTTEDADDGEGQSTDSEPQTDDGSEDSDESQ